MPDPFLARADAVDAPSRRVAAVVPSDSADLPDLPKALWVAAPGTVALVAADDAANTGTAMGELPAGTLIPVRARRVRATGTTAAVVALY